MKPWFLLLLTLLLASCRSDELIFPSESDEVGSPSGEGGFYLLNEGNMGSNKCTLDFYDFASGVYSRNIYSERNPEQVMELGDVGNDIAVYGSKLYVTVNCSHKVEVLDAATARRIAQIDIPNCRYLAFHKGNAYVSSYIGPVGADPSCPLGAVFRIDTLSLKVTGQVAVGYQPEELAIAEDMLFVANSGGYRQPNYDRSVSAISLSDFSPAYTVDVDINLHRLKADRYGNLWTNSRGNGRDIPSSLIKLSMGDSGRFTVERRFDFPCDNFAFRGDSLLYFSSSSGKNSYGILNVIEGVTLGSFVSPEVERAVMRPYAIAVNPASGDIFLTDARNYVSSGTVWCLSGSGEKRWSARTGDIPAAIAFTSASAGASPSPPMPPAESGRGFASRVFEYCPAPGQFVNELPLYADGDSYADILRKCEEAMCGGVGSPVSLGGFGGYITFGFDEMVPNVEGEADFRLYGNAVWQSADIRGGSAEPGIVFVSYDANGNGLPDDSWFELAGSEYRSPATVHDYRITYRRESGGIRWTDSLGESGLMAANPFHTQSYWPLWLDAEAELSFSGPRLAPNAVDVSVDGSNFILYSYPYGYADNYPNSYAAENSFDISSAVDSEGRPVSLPGIHFVRVMTALNQQCGRLGESSTEISGAQNLH